MWLVGCGPPIAWLREGKPFSQIVPVSSHQFSGAFLPRFCPVLGQLHRHLLPRGLAQSIIHCLASLSRKTMRPPAPVPGCACAICIYLYLYTYLYLCMFSIFATLMFFLKKTNSSKKFHSALWSPDPSPPSSLPCNLGPSEVGFRPHLAILAPIFKKISAFFCAWPTEILNMQIWAP